MENDIFSADRNAKGKFLMNTAYINNTFSVAWVRKYAFRIAITFRSASFTA